MQQQEVHQQEVQQAEEERRQSGQAASTSASPASSPLLGRLFSKQGQQGNVKARNTTVDEMYKPFLDAWDKGFVETEEDPDGYFMETVAGSLPRELEGTLFRNGPGKFAVGSDKVQHPYDGDGLILSIAIRDGKAFFRSRFVKTAE